MNTKFYNNVENEFERKLDDKPTLRNLVNLEHLTLKYWESEKVLEKLREKNQNGPEFSFLDGPITANNPMGVHHAWGRTMKDVVQRYKAMQGFNQRFQNGFDTQGLWLEVEVEKSLNLNSKRDLENYGLEKFAEKCKQRVDTYSKLQTEQSKRLGQAMDWENSYYTHTDENVSAIWFFLKHCHDQGWLYKANRPMPWCSRCGTSLSQHEQADSYKEVNHEAVYVKLYVPSQNFSLLVWTTTPWTLPANMAVAVHPKLTYLEYQHPETSEVLVAGQWLNKSLFKEWNVLKSYKGHQLKDLEYQNMFPEFELSGSDLKPVLLWDEVSEEEGTGLVHLAPGCGSEDFELGKQYNLTVVSPLDENGKYTEGFGNLTSLYYKDVNYQVQNELKQKRLLFQKEVYTHRYPHCWRCKEELVYRSVEEWFLSTDELRPKLKSAASSVKWTPEHVGKLFQNWLDNMGDWCISRKRYWGLPLPFYPCKCGFLNVLSSKEELANKAVGDFSKVKELHRPWVDEVKVRCENCNEPVSRVLEVGDCWLDAGVTPFSTLDYFNDFDYWQKWYPADFVCEMREQVRLWFYSTMFMGVVLTGKSPYRQVVSYEKVHDKLGKPMHKSDGNAVWFDDAVEEVGADPLRLYYLSQNLGTFMHFNLDDTEKFSRTLLTFWNVMKFLKPLAKLDNYLFTGLVNLNVLDWWLLSRLDQFRENLNECYEKYHFTKFTSELLSFTNDVSNWYLRLSRRRFWNKNDRDSKNAAYATLTFVLLEFSKLMAPMTPFFSEFLYQNLREFLPDSKPSVHLEVFPTTYRNLNSQLNENMEKTRDLVTMVHNLRSKSNLKVKQPLQELVVSTDDEALNVFLQELKPFVLEELNLKELNSTNDLSKYLELTVSLDYRSAGRKFKADLKQANKLVSENVSKLTLFYYSDQNTLKLGDLVFERSDFVFNLQPKEGYVKNGNQFFDVVLNTQLSENLKTEGMMREFLRYVQLERQRMNLDLTQSVKLEFHSSKDFANVVNDYRSLLLDEALVVELMEFMTNDKLTPVLVKPNQETSEKVFLKLVPQ